MRDVHSLHGLAAARLKQRPTPCSPVGCLELVRPRTDSAWVATSGLLMEVPLDPQRWVQQACDLVGRDLTEDESERWTPGNDAPQSACD